MSDALEQNLQRYIPKEEILDVFRLLIAETYNDMTKDMQASKRQILSQVKDYEKRITHIKDLLATNKIDPADYLEIKTRYRLSLEQLNTKLNSFNDRLPSLETLLCRDIMSVMKLDKIFIDGKDEDARTMISMLYPEKIIFNEVGFERSKVNKVVKYSYHRTT